MSKRWLCGFLAAILLLGLAAGFPLEVSAASAMTSSDALVEYLKQIEGFSAKPYWDYGQWTVGYGTECPSDKLDEYRTVGISQEAALELLQEALKTFEKDINTFIDTYALTLTQNQFDALVSFSYNCGTQWTRETDGFFNNVVRSGDKGNAFLYGICLWSTAGGEFILLDRRMSEANMYINGEYKPYNSTEPAYPDHYRWVFLDGCGGTVQYRVYGFDAASPMTIATSIKAAPTGTDSSGKKFTYTFGGWYTSDGKKVEQTDASLSRNQVLYARWLDPAGNVADLSKDGPVKNLTVTVTAESVNIRSGPGTHCTLVGSATAGTAFSVSEVYTTTNYTWGRTPEGWIVLDFTNYAAVSTLNGWVEESGKWAYYEKGTKVKNKWVKDSAGWCYLDANGYMAVNKWVADSVGWCYVGADGHIVKDRWIADSVGWRYADDDGYLLTNAWVEDRVGWCYVGADGYCLTNCWQKDSVGWCYLDGSGRMVKNAWVHDGQGWCYLNESGYRISGTWQASEAGLRYIGDDGYALTDCWFDGAYLDSDGVKVTSRWVKDAKGWFYVDADGKLVTDAWQESEAGLRYVGADGYALTDCWHEDFYLGSDGVKVVGDWVKDTKGWCYLDDEGYRVTDTWQQAGEGLRYLGADGYAVTDSWVEGRYLKADGILAVNAWVEKDGKPCYVGGNGYVVTNRWVHDGKGWRYAGADGYCVAGRWQVDSKGWCYLNADGYMATNKWIRDSVGWCYVGADGYCRTNCWQKDSVGWCYLDGSGRMVYSRWVRDSRDWCYVGDNGYMRTNGWAKDSVGWYWMGADGYAIKSTSRTINGKTYHFNASGLCTNP